MSPLHSKNFRVHNFPSYELGIIAQEVISARQAGRDIIDLGHFNPDLPPPVAAVNKLVSAALLPHNYRYSASQGISKLRHTFATWYQKRFGVELDPEREVAVTLGTKEGLAHMLLATLSPGDAVILPTPAYPIHRAAISIAGAVAMPVALAPNEFFERLAITISQSSPRPKMLVLSFPHNPTTQTVQPEFFERVVAFAAEHELMIVHDFAYAECAFDDYRAPSFLQASGAKEWGVEFYSLSKGFSLPGWRLGFCVGNELMIGALKKIKSNLDSGAFQPLQIAAISVLEQWRPIVEETVTIYRSRRDALVDGLNEIDWSTTAPQATPFVWTKVPPVLAKQSGFQLAHQLLSECNVAVCPGVGFDPSAEGYVRFSLAEPENRIRQAVRAIGELL